MEKYTTSSNQTISEVSKISIKTKTSMDRTLNEFNSLSSTCWNEKYQPLTIDMTKEKYTDLYRLGLKSLFIPDTNPF